MEQLLNEAFIVAALWWAYLAICMPFVLLIGYFVWTAVKKLFKDF